jgi:hypothetical protein
MAFRILADAVVLLHLAFVAFVMLGGLLALRRPRAALLHLPAAVYGFLVEALGWVCPLTPLEVALRRRGGEAGYPGGFVERYLLAVLYPEPFPRSLAWKLAAAVLVVNAVIYGLVAWRRWKRD